MPVFSVNQAHHLYVAKAFGDPSLPAAVLGTINAAGDNGGTGVAKNHIYFPYLGYGGLVRSDLIKVRNITDARSISASAMEKPLKVMSLKTNAVNGGSPIVGQHYIARICYRQFIGMSDEDRYFEQGEVYIDTAMSESQFYVKMAISLAKNTFKQSMVGIYLVTSAGVETPVYNYSTEASFTGTYAKIFVRELEQPWLLGTKSRSQVYFELQTSTVKLIGADVVWSTITVETPTTALNNSKDIADLEYFCMGERGDIYRNVGWPHSIPVKYMVNPESTTGYHMFSCHYYYEGDNEAVQKSEKDITVVCEDATTLNSFIAAFNALTGFSVPAVV